MTERRLRRGSNKEAVYFAKTGLIAVFMSKPTASAISSNPFSINSSIARSNWVHSLLQVIVFSFLFVSAKNESERISDGLFLPTTL
jgi:hypothetical protein